MESSKGIENPAFVPSSPDTPRRVSASPSYVEVSALPTDSPREDSQPQEPQMPQKSPELPLPSATAPGSHGPAGPASLSACEEGPYGWGNFQPRCLQRCNTPQGFLLHYCLLAVTQGNVQRRPERALAVRAPAGGSDGCAGDGWSARRAGRSPHGTCKRSHGTAAAGHILASTF